MAIKKTFKVYVLKSGKGSIQFARKRQAQPLIDALVKFGYEYELTEATQTIEVPDVELADAGEAE